MFYRFTSDGRRKTADLKDAFGGAVFLCGGHPSLLEEPLERFQEPGIMSFALNNTGTVFKPNLWIGADKAQCYSHSILKDPSIMKFGRLMYRDDIIDESPMTRWRHMPNQWFYVIDEDYNHQTVCHDSHTLVWWKNVFILAVQFCYRLGFKKIYFCGTAFKMDDEKHYAYDVTLSKEQLDYNRRTYHCALGDFIRCLPIFQRSGVQFVSCTPESSMNQHIQYMPFNDAIDEAKGQLPNTDLSEVKHSSQTT